MLQERYRQDYDGEFVVVETVIKDGNKSQSREWIANPIENQHVSGRAACIGSNWDRSRFKYSRLERHRGGLRGSKRLQTYGTGSVWQDMRLDFYATTTSKHLKAIDKAGYYQNTVVYAPPSDCIERPGCFYIVPYLPRLCNLALPVYLAAFDGHREIFLLGYNQEMPSDENWHQDINEIIMAYSATQFVFVGFMPGVPTLWRYNKNFQQMDYRDWICHCDV